jgi:hypothetical protein
VVPLLLFEQPDILLYQNSDTLGPLARHPVASVAFLSLVANHPDEEIAAEARMHVNLAREAEDGNWEREAEQAIARLHPTVVDAPIIQLLGLGGIAPWLVAPLLLHGDERIRRAVAESPGTPGPLLASYRRAGARHDLVGYAAPRPGVDPELLEQLSAGGPWARCLAARHPATAQPLLERLLGDPAVEVRGWVARNPALPPALLIVLARDQHPTVRYWAARHPHIPAEHLQLLAGDSTEQIRIAVAGNPVTPAAVVALLACDNAWRVRRQAARHPALSEEALAHSACDPERLVRYEIARRPDLPPWVRGTLALDGDPVVRWLLTEWAERVSKKPAPEVASPESVLLPRRVECGPDTATLPVPAAAQEVADLLRVLLTTHTYFPLRRAMALAHPAIAPARLSESIRGAWIERYAAARNPQAPEELLRIFIRDTNRVVRAAAQTLLSSAATVESP